MSLVHQSAGAALQVAGQLATHGQPAVAGLVHDATVNAFDFGISIGSIVAGAAAVVGALFALMFLPSHSPQQVVTEALPHELAKVASGD